VWKGDGKKMANLWIEAAGIFGFRLTLACPNGFTPDEAILAQANAHLSKQGRPQVTVVASVAAAMQGADVVSTDVWASMGQEEEAATRAKAFAGFQVNKQNMSYANADAMVLHCLPAHRGEEISADVLEGPQSHVWQQAENRLHAQKAIMTALLPA